MPDKRKDVDDTDETIVYEEVDDSSSSRKREELKDLIRWLQLNGYLSKSYLNTVEFEEDELTSDMLTGSGQKLLDARYNEVKEMASREKQARVWGYIEKKAGAVVLDSFLGTGTGLPGFFLDPTDDTDKQLNKADWKGLIPGVGAHRNAMRLRSVADKSNKADAHGTANLVAEQLGRIPSLATATLAGGLLGTIAGGSKGAVTGAGAGLGVGIGANIIATIAAAIRKRRTLKEQAEKDTVGRAVAKYLVPGLSTYDTYKRLGASRNL